MERQAYRPWETPEGKEYIAFMNDPDNVCDCANCPENHTGGSWGCGQQNCWVKEHCKASFVVWLKKDGASSPIDNIEADHTYTAEQYIKDCLENADDAWNEMLASGTVTLEEY